MYLTILAIAVSWLTASLPATAAAGYCGACHRSGPAAVHAGLTCHDCHLAGDIPLADPADWRHGAKGCVRCHRGYQQLFAGVMGPRAGERDFVARTWGRHDRDFWQKNCDSCHLTGCGSCHGSGHRIVRPATQECLACHRGYFTGWDYLGRAPREDNNRYQRGPTANGETFLTMLPDVHFRAGLACADCHTMASLLTGRKSARACRDCHEPSRSVAAHRIAGHLERLTCAACHAAWSAQEFGTFYLRFTDRSMQEEFDLQPQAAADYLRSSHYRRQDLPPLGLNAAGMVSPIRPEFIAFYTDVAAARRGGPENRLLAAQWRAFTPHTIQRGTASCGACHDNPRRFLAEPEDQRIFLLRRDGLPLDSYWHRAGQQVANGGFYPMERLQLSPAALRNYRKEEVAQWQRLLRQDAPLSAD